MEIAGLALGVLPLIFSASRGYRECAALLETCRSYTNDFRKSEEKFVVQLKIFDRECLLLLSKIVNQKTAIDMLANESHSSWCDKNLRDRWAATLGGCFDTPLKVIAETLKEIEQEFSSYISSQGQLFHAFVQKVDWSFSGKQKIQTLLSALRQRNQDLRCLREQEKSLQKSQRKSLGIKGRPPSSETQAFTLAIRDAASRLYDSLAATAVCPCHHVNLQLQCLEKSPANPLPIPKGGSPRSSAIIQTVSFRFVVTTDEKVSDVNSSTQDCTCLTVNSELHLIDFTSQNISEISGEGGKMDTSVNARRAHIKFSSTESKRARQLPLNVTAPKNDAINPCNMPIENIQTIEDLCSRLKSFQLKQGLRADECLGIIRSLASDTKYSHRIYHDPHLYDAASKVSLSSIFAHVDKRRLLPREERLKIAFILSLSLLYFGSYPTSWFQDRWRTHDIFFFLGLEENLPAAESTLIPYISAFFQRPPEKTIESPSILGKTIPSRSAVGLARNEKLFSLALALIEIAFGDIIFNLSELSMLSGVNQNEFTEYIKAKSIVDSRLLVKEMGKDYAEVVKRCFYCDFGINEEDLSKREVQEIFYERVVCDLERCLKKFQGD